MKLVGTLIYLLGNVYLGILYVRDLVKYYDGDFNYDGIRYLIPISIADILFIVGLILIYISYRFSNYFKILLTLALLHNVNMGMGVDRIPFIGLLIVLTSIVIILRKILFQNFR